jgi:type IV pilus assembly protein PilP
MKSWTGAAVMTVVMALIPASAIAADAKNPPVSGEEPVFAPREQPEVPPFDPTGKRDPFRPFLLDLRDMKKTGPLTPLQRYDLGQLSLVAILWEISPPRAMVEDSLGMGYIVTVGTPIGRNNGVVKSIEPDHLVVEERVLDLYGQERTADVVVGLPKSTGTKQRGRER